MSWLSIVVLFWCIARMIRGYREGKKSWRYALTPRRNWALALAHPIAFAQIDNGFADAPAPLISEELARLMRPVMLHLFGLRNEMSDEQIRFALARQLPSRWFRIGLDALAPEDDPRDAMAFACARLAFAVRVAFLLGWIGEDMQWNILYQNAQRAEACFAGWLDYGAAWARGRRQWVARSRADGLGAVFDERKVRDWVTDSAHPWCWMTWALPPLPPERASSRWRLPFRA